MQTPIATAPAGGSDQHGLSAEGGVDGFYMHCWAADKRVVMNHPTAALLPIALQRSKLWLWAAVLAMSGVCTFAPVQLSRFVGASAVSITLAGIALGVVALLGVSLSIRCPRCGLSLAWYALSKQSHSAWLSWLLDVQTCPRCDFEYASNGDQHAK